MRRISLVLVLAVILSASAAEPPPKAALDAIDAGDMLKHIKVLASDEFEGRAPGSKGEELTVKYIAEQFKAVGLKPGNPNGSYMQEVPMAGVITDPTATIKAGDEAMQLRFPDDYVAFSSRLQSEINVENSEIVFVGYGVVAPEYGWDDYKDVDVSGKTILMLINDPAIPDPSDPAKLDPKMFKGRAMTYYGRWTYKYEIAAEKGAAAAIIIHETEPAAYPYSVVQSSWATENFEIDAADKNMKDVAVRSWLHLDAAKKLLAASGQDFDTLKKAALAKDFRPVSLGATATFNLKQTVRPFKSINVVGKSEGSDPKRKDEWLLYTAHWDHLGRDLQRPADNIYNGAVDNASGVAAIIEIAQAHQKLPKATKRSALFMATTAEESGLLGAKFYAENPLYPLGKTVGNINIDGTSVWGKTKDIESISDGNSTLDDMLVEAASRRSRVVKPNSKPERGAFYRADHFEFSKLGVPALYTGRGKEVIGKPADFGHNKSEEYVANIYHQPSDEVDPSWDLSGAAEDMQMLFEIGYQVANGDTWPEWKPGTEFKAKRDGMLKR
ncbi:MAG TPA: M28 family peptidase [Chthoniobacterales bacterium]|nr:M28 family peptidase [Chthoniobacterales bacterium]